MIQGLFMTISSELPAQSQVQQERKNIAQSASVFVSEERSRYAGLFQSRQRGALM